MFSRGTTTRCLADNFGSGLSSFFPAVVIEVAGTLLSGAEVHDNLSTAAEAYVSSLAVPGSSLFFHAVAIMHTPTYRSENSGALLSDWPRIPLPSTADLLSHSATLGHRLADLLDAESSVNLTAEWSFLAALKLPLDTAIEEALKVTAGWGYLQGNAVMPGTGVFPTRLWTDPEREKLATLAAAQSLTPDQVLALLGDTCADVHLNGAAFWSAVPSNVWDYTLGGYQVLKKWLSYRELSLLGHSLHPDEAQYFAQVVRRITAILLLGPALDSSCQAILLPPPGSLRLDGQFNVEIESDRGAAGAAAAFCLERADGADRRHKRNVVSLSKSLFLLAWPVPHQDKSKRESLLLWPCNPSCARCFRGIRDAHIVQYSPARSPCSRCTSKLLGVPVPRLVSWQVVPAALLVGWGCSFKHFSGREIIEPHFMDDSVEVVVISVSLGSDVKCGLLIPMSFGHTLRGRLISDNGLETGRLRLHGPCLLRASGWKLYMAAVYLRI